MEREQPSRAHALRGAWGLIHTPGCALVNENQPPHRDTIRMPARVSKIEVSFTSALGTFRFHIRHKPLRSQFSSRIPERTDFLSPRPFHDGGARLSKHDASPVRWRSQDHVRPGTGQWFASAGVTAPGCTASYRGQRHGRRQPGGSPRCGRRRLVRRTDPAPACPPLPPRRRTSAVSCRPRA